jgi:ABC-type transport system involved in multi-copper enzyme maturation permease subunit
VDWTILIGVTIALGLIRLEKGEIRSKFFLKEVFILWAVVLLLDFAVRYFNKTYSLSLYNYLPVTAEIWIGGIMIFSFACYLSFKIWRKHAKTMVDTNKPNNIQKKLD